MNVPYYLTIDKGLVHFGSEVRKVSYSHHGVISWLGPRSCLCTSSGVLKEIELSKGGVLDNVFKVELRVWRLKSASEAIVRVECSVNCLGLALEAF
jgi:hypothetical protein